MTFSECVSPASTAQSCNWDIPATHAERLALAWRDCPFGVGELSSLPPHKRRRLYAKYGLPRTINPPVDAAFLVHPRGMWPSDNDTSTLEEDISRHFPEWCAVNFGITPLNFNTKDGRKRRYQLYRTMQANTPPGIVVGQYKGLDVRVLIIASNMVPEFMMRSLIDIPFAPPFIRRLLQAPFLKDGQLRLINAAIFAHEICGARILGLGAMNALATRFGQDILDCYQGVSDTEKPQIVTGHRVTTAVMADIACAALVKLGFTPNIVVDDRKPSIGIIGAGSIGTAAILELVSRGFKNASVFIIDTKSEKACTLQQLLLNMGVKAQVISDIKPQDWDSVFSDSFPTHPLHSLRLVDVVLAAPSSVKPFLKAQFFAGGVIVINDSQPPVTTHAMMRPTQDHPGGLLLEVLGSLPPGVSSTFDTGCPPGTDFTCAIETIVAALLYRGGIHQQNYSQRVDPNDIVDFYGRVQASGFCTKVVFTNGGQLLSDDIWNSILQIRANRSS